MSKKIFTLLIIIIALFFISCTWASDLDNSTLDSSLAQDDIQELEASNETSEVLAASNSEENVLSSAESSNDKDSSTNLILDNDADKENLYVGDRVTWIIEVYNAGPNDAKKVKVFDQLPDGLKYIKYKATHGTFNPKTGIWDIGNLTKYTRAVLEIITEALTPGEKVNKANLTSETVNVNDETYEEEEIDVFEVEKDEDVKEHQHYLSKTIESTGNPLVLLLISLFGCIVFRKNW